MLFRVLVLAVGIFLFLGAVLVASVHLAEPIPGEHCMAMTIKNGQAVAVCPDTQYVRHVGIGIFLGVVAIAMIVGSTLGLRRP